MLKLDFPNQLTRKKDNYLKEKKCLAPLILQSRLKFGFLKRRIIFEKKHIVRSCLFVFLFFFFLSKICMDLHLT